MILGLQCFQIRLDGFYYYLAFSSCILHFIEPCADGFHRVTANAWNLVLTVFHLFPVVFQCVFYWDILSVPIFVTSEKIVVFCGRKGLIYRIFL